MDSNADGVGDLRGVIEKLDYFKGSPGSLGIDAIWFSPIYSSPMADFGYDVSDYRDIHPLFGTLDDFRDLIKKAHQLHIKVMLDFVPNHSSDEHPWFVESKSSRDNPKRDYYTWADPKADGSLPNNWLSIFGGSAWQWDETSGQYYLHTFLKEQPDLNWENPAVRKEMQDILHFWFELGVDGIRADAVRWMSKDVHMRDDPRNPGFVTGPHADEFGKLIHVHSRFGPKLFDYLREMTDVVEEYPGRIMIFEDYPDDVFTTRDQYLGFYGVNPKVSMPFNFEGIGTPFNAESYRRFITEFQGMLNQEEHMPVYTFGNHDQSRLVSRVGEEQARVVAMMQFALPGLPVIYYGDELGMKDGKIKKSELQDPVELRKPGLGQGRDPERTPMQWDTSQYAGFSTVKPWLPVTSTASTHNAIAERSDDDSYFTLYQQLLGLRRRYRIFREGDYETFGEADKNVYVFSRRFGEEHIFVVLNMSKKSQNFELPHNGRILASAHPARPPRFKADGTLKLKPFDAVIVECSKHQLKEPRIVRL